MTFAPNVALSLLLSVSLAYNNLEFSSFFKSSGDPKDAGAWYCHLWSGSKFSGTTTDEFLTCYSTWPSDLTTLFRIWNRSQVVSRQWTGNEDNSSYGRNSIIGDVDGDGHAETLICDPYSSGLTLAGALWIHSGVDGTLLRGFRGESIGDAFGRHVLLISDVDTDGWRDIVVSAAASDPRGMGNAGSVYLISTRTGDVLWRHDGTRPSEGLPREIDSLGDVDDDGMIDFVIASDAADVNGQRRAGRVWIISGRTQKTLFEIKGENEGDFVGAGVTAIGDTDFDGKADFLVGKTGEEWLYSSGRKSRRYALTREIDFSGEPYFAGDYDRDGVADFWTSSAALSVYGAQLHSGVDGSIIGLIEFPGRDTWVGQIVGIDDVTGDGLRDVILTQPGLQTIQFFQTNSLTNDGNTKIGQGQTEVALSIHAPALSGEHAFLVFSFSASEGTDLLDRRIPLDDDALLQWSLRHPTWFKIDDRGRARVPLTLPPVSEASRPIYATYLALDNQNPGRLRTVSNAQPLLP